MRHPAIILLLSLAAAACRPSPLAPGVSDSAFVRVMAALRRVPSTGPTDSAARQRSRDSILRANRVTAPQIESAAVSLATQPMRASELWRAIERQAAPPRHP